MTNWSSDTLLNDKEVIQLLRKQLAEKDVLIEKLRTALDDCNKVMNVIEEQRETIERLLSTQEFMTVTLANKKELISILEDQI